MPSPETEHEQIGSGTARALQFRLATAQREGRVPSVVAAIARRGAPVWSGAAGRLHGADGSDAGPAPTPEVQYRIGSITKTTVAVLVLRLVERGEVDLDDPIGDHLTGCPAPESTIRQLLTHTSGIASETPPPWWERTSGEHRPALADILPDPALRHRPGHVHHYSNPGYGLLGALVAAKEGRPWFDVLSEQVLTPLRMTRTSYLPVEPHALGWAVHPWADVMIPEPAHDHGLLAAAGQLWSTPDDLCRFGVFLGGDGAGILTRATMELMRSPAVAPNDAGWSGSYGLGVQHLRFGELVMFGHTGSMPGFLATVMTSADAGLTVGVQANAWSDLAMGELVRDLVQIVREHEPTMPVPWRPARADSTTWQLVGPWYWGAVAVAVSLRADGSLEIGALGKRARVGRFVRDEQGRWRGEPNSYYHGEFLEPRHAADGTVTHLDLGSFVLTRRPYAPAEVVPDGLGLGDWLLDPATDAGTG